MERVVTVQQLTAKFARLDSTQKQMVDEFVTFLLSKQRALKPDEAKRLLLQTSVWIDEDIQQTVDVPKETKLWQAPASS